jgi:hypothetical protein
MLGERKRRRWLLEHGAETDATVLAVEDTGWSRGDGVGVEVELRLRLEPADEPSYETTRREWTTRSAMPRTGDRIVVRYDPGERDAWAWDGEHDGGRKPQRPMDIARLHPAADRADRLEALAELREVGALSDAEYETQRTEILDEL